MAVYSHFLQEKTIKSGELAIFSKFIFLLGSLSKGLPDVAFENNLNCSGKRNSNQSTQYTTENQAPEQDGEHNRHVMHLDVFAYDFGL